MHFATPIWLLALVPWAALAAWMLWGRREQVAVPFLDLWEGADARPKASRAVRPPPMAIVLILLSILLAILAAATPTTSLPQPPLITVLVDRGITMSARDGDAYRYQRAAALLSPHLAGLVEVLTVPSRDIASLADVSSLPPTALDTSDDVTQAAMRLLAMTDGPLVVLTDVPLAVSDPRLVVVAPQPLKSNAGIAHVAARDRPAAQVMVGVSGDPSFKRAVVVSSDGQRVEREVAGTAFIDMPQVGQTIEVALAQGDALSADDRAWLVREWGWPRIEPGVDLPAELTRMIEAYRKLRPSRDGAAVVSIVGDVDNAAGEAVIFAPATEPANGAAVPEVADHPVTRGVAWAQVCRDARVGSSQALPAGFVPVVSRGERVAVAVREQPARQVWMALESSEFPRRADYVVFWTNVFDWLGQGGEEFVSHPIGLLGSEWKRQTDGPDGTEPGLWPGLYRRSDGTLRAVNARPVELPQTPPPSTGWRERLATLSRTRTGASGGRSFSPYLLLAAIGCALGAAWLWPAQRRARTPVKP